MSMNQLSSKSEQSHKIKTKHKRLIAILTLLAILASIYMYFDVLAHNAFSVLQTDMSKIEQSTILPAGGVFQSSSAKGTNALERTVTCYLQTCPELTTTWVVPIEPGGDDAFIKTLLNNVGYVNDINGIPHMGGKFKQNGYADFDQIDASVFIDAADNYHDKIPADKNYGTKQWRRVTVFISGPANFIK